jgi:hypothetical protein
MEAERDRERGTIEALEGDLRKAAGGRARTREQGRFRRTVVLGFSLGVTIVVGLILLLAEIRR